MTKPAEGPRWYARPKVVLPLIGGILVLSALFAPEVATGRSGDNRLTTHSTHSLGARLFYDLSRKLGFKVSRREKPDLAADPTTIHALLSVRSPLRAREVHEVLEHVRAGGGLLLMVAEGGDAVADSLHIRTSTGGTPAITPEDTAGCGLQPKPTFPQLWPAERAILYQISWRRNAPQDQTTFLSVRTSGPGVRRNAEPALIGFPYGRGRIVIGSDPDLVRNDALRVCAFGLDVPVVRALDWLRDGGDAPRDKMVFDEFHHGYGAQPGAMRAIGEYLVSAPSGRAFTQALAAGLILLAAFAPRLVMPRDAERIERRSPLEHVDALARAYERVGATRTVVARLVRGVRRRLHQSSRPGLAQESDAEFLARAARQKPAIAPDVERIKTALARKVSPTELEEVGASLQRLETSLTRM